MNWKPSVTLTDRLCASLDDEFETVAKPVGARRPSSARRAPADLTISRREPPGTGADEPDSEAAQPWRRSAERGDEGWRARRSGVGQDGARTHSVPMDGAPNRGGKTGHASKGPSLKMRAVGYLSRREHAREELGRKLASHAQDPADIDAVLDALTQEGWLSTERFAQSLVHRRASRQGVARIVQELRLHGVSDSQVTELRQQLRVTEYERALAVWRKRFGVKPQDRAAYAKQARFLVSRGFTRDVARRILGADDD